MWPQRILSGHAPDIILCGGGCGEPGSLPAVRGHPRRGVLLQLSGVQLQLGEMLEGISAIQRATVDQAREEIARRRAVQGLTEERIPAVPNRRFPTALDDVVVQRRARRLRGKAPASSSDSASTR